MFPGLGPIIGGDCDPFLVGETGKGGAESRWVRGGEERRVLDAREDVEVGEGREHEHGDYRLYGRKDGVGRQRPEYGTHFGGT